MAANLIGSEIIKLAADINKRIQQGEQIYNFTIGDFDPQVFPIPEALEEKDHTGVSQQTDQLPGRQWYRTSSEGGQPFSGERAWINLFT